MQQHRTLAAPRRPRGVGDNRQVIPARHLWPQQPVTVEKGLQFPSRLDDLLQLGKIFARAVELWLTRLVRDAETDTGVAEDMRELASSILGVHGDDHAAGQVCPHVGRQEIGVVAQE